ncbi:hypothetical protein [Caulobacter phage Cr30]|uniref:hypothetical protein n=1 Tax=Caulobacter phage Cr30 TaxID=1357714 RepID=UPI0004A9B80E|nr:hypothetical protein OZ74_gp122 [Caulobacter phage Cr30]AGS81007.1 hypothetical protein [Caulobacter phage Cr30]
MVQSIMNIDDYVIAVRSYQRAMQFRDKTYTMLSKQHIDLSEKLYIFVANEEEKKEYRESLGDNPYKEIVVGVKGGKEIVHFISDFFPINQKIFFLDDDLEEFFEFNPTPSKTNFIAKSTNLEAYIQDGFKTLDELGLNTAFSFSYYKNDFYLQGKPWKEFRPYNLPGGSWGARNDPDFVKIYTAHLDDIVRTCRYIDKAGGIVIYHWGGFKTSTGMNPGGMQSSGDRGGDDRNAFMMNVAEEVYAKDELVRKYCSEPKLVKHTGMTEVKLKSITSISKIRPFDRVSWKEYFQEHPDIEDPISDLSKLF